MPLQTARSSYSILSHADGIAVGMSDAVLLLARVLIASLVFLPVWSGSPNVAYLTSLGVPNPAFWSLVAIAVEFVTAFSLVFGIATRYGALLGLLYVIVATAIAHRYWEYPQAQQLIQYTNFTKNVAIAGGLLLKVFVNGAGRFGIDRILSGKG